MSLFWRVGGLQAQGRRWIARALGLDGGQPPQRAKALLGLGLLGDVEDRPASARAALEESLVIYRGLDDARGVARALFGLGMHAMSADPAHAVRLFERSAVLARRCGDAWCLVHALSESALVRVDRDGVGTARRLAEEAALVADRAGDAECRYAAAVALATVAARRGDYDEAERLWDEVLALCGDIGGSPATTTALFGLGRVAAGRGDYARARRLLHEALALSRAGGDRAGTTRYLCGLGDVVLSHGDVDEAARLFEEALRDLEAGGLGPLDPARAGMARVAVMRSDVPTGRRLAAGVLASARERGDARTAARALFDLALVARSEQKITEAERLQHEALQLRAELGDSPGVVDSLEALAGLAVGRDRGDRAARLFGAAQALRDTRGYARAPAAATGYEADVAALRRQLGGQRCTDGWAKGIRLSLDQAVSYAAKRRGSQARAKTGWASVTRAEGAVVALVAEGLTNTEIAERLFVSPRTVGSHIHHVFAKLGVRSRTELANLVLRGDGLDALNSE